MSVLFGIVLSALILLVVLSMLIRRQLREKYAFFWIVISLCMVFLGVFPGALVFISRLVGVQVPSNLLFALAIFLLVGVTLHLSWEMSRNEERIRRLVEEVAILRADADGQSHADAASRGSEGPPGDHGS